MNTLYLEEIEEQGEHVLKKWFQFIDRELEIVNHDL